MHTTGATTCGNMEKFISNRGKIPRHEKLPYGKELTHSELI